MGFGRQIYTLADPNVSVISRTMRVNGNLMKKMVGTQPFVPIQPMSYYPEFKFVTGTKISEEDAKLIFEHAQTNEAIAELLEKAIVLYNLSKEQDNNLE